MAAELPQDLFTKMDCIIEYRSSILKLILINYEGVISTGIE